MASPYDQEEEEVAAERELGDDAMWKVIQKNTFTRWANENLKSSTAKLVITDLEKDLSDGLKLISLVECLSGKKFQKFNRRPTFRTQKFENVTMSLKFLEHDEGIRIVNIDSSDIVDNKIKLIMGLIWTLILHYSISMPTWDDEDPSAKDQTPKQRLLAWIQSKIPQKKITNFTSDWNDGTALAALVDALVPGTFPNLGKMIPKDALNNAKAAEDAAEKLLDIPQLIKPDEMINPKVDELSMMTYLSRFPNAKAQGGPAPAADKVNPARCKAYGPGLEPTGNVVGAPARFIVETAGAGKGELQVVVVNPKGGQEKCEVFANKDMTVSYSCVYFPTVEGQYKITIKFAGKDIPKSPYQVQVTGKVGDPSKCYAQGPGIEPKGVKTKKKTYFEVITKGAGAGVVDVGIVDPSGKKDTVKTTITKKSDDVWYVEYTPVMQGLHSVNVYFAGKVIPKSPFAVAVSAEGGALLDPSRLPKPTACTPREAAIASIATPLKAAPGSTARDPDEQPEVAAPAGPGTGAAPGTPGDGVKRAWATGRGIQPKGVRIGELAEFKVLTENAGVSEPKVMIVGPGGITEKVTIKKVSTTYEYSYKPMKAGTYIITITFDGKGIPKSPFKVEVTPVKQSKVKAYGPGLETGVVNQLAPFTVEPNGEGPIGFKIEGPSQAKIDVQKDAQTGSMDVTYLPTIEGEYAVHVLCNNDDIPNSPFMADIKPAPAGFDPSKVIASGPGLERTGVVVNKQTEFTVDARQAGKATLTVTAYDVDGGRLNVLVTDNKNSTYTCRYTATRSVKYTISVVYGGATVPKSPFKVFVSEVGTAPGAPGAAPGGAGASKVKVYGPAVEGPVKPRQATYFVIDCKEAGPGQPQVLLVDARNMPVAFKMADNKDRTFKVDFTPVTVGVYTLTVNFTGKPVPGSPFKISVDALAPAPGAGNPSKVKVYGPAIEKPVPTNTLTYLIIDCKEAGPGEPMFSMLSDKGQVVQYKITNNQDRTYRVEFELTVSGSYNANVFFTGKPVPGNPFKVTAETATPASKVKVYGPAVEQPVFAYQTTYLIIDCKEAGDGQPLVTLTNDKGAQVPYKITDNKDKTYRVEFQATVTGIHTANIFFSSRPVPKSPFKIDVQPSAGPPLDLSKISVRGLPETVPINKETPFEIVTAGAGPGVVKATVTAPSGRSFPVVIDQKPDVAAAKFTPTEAGPHTVAVTFNDQPVPNSPFRVVAQAPNSNLVRVYGPALENPVATYQSTYIIVDCKEAGPGQPSVSLLDTKGQPVPFNILDNKDQTYRVEFTAVTTGTIVANVVFAGQPVPKSPFRVTVQAGVRVYGPAVEGPVAPQQTTYLVVDCKEAGPGQPQVQVTTEQGQTLQARLTDNGDRTYKVEFEPNVPTGTTLIASVTFNNAPVPNSPFRILVSSSAITVKDLPKTVPVGRPVPFKIVTAGAGPGQVKVNVVGPSGRVAPAPVGQAPDGFVSQILATEPGPQQVHVTFNDQPVPNSPFTVTAVPEGQLPNVTVKDLPETVPVGKPVPFNIVTGPAGPGQAKVNILSPSGQLTPAPVSPGPEGFVSQVQATEPGPHEVYVAFNDQPIQKSPFKVTAVPDGQTPGISVKDLPKTVPVGRPVPFKIVTAGAGPGQAKVNVVGPSGRLAPAPVGQAPDGFVSQILATEPGPQQVHVTFNDQPVPNSPFTVTAVPEGQLPNVTVKDLPETVPVGKPVPFNIVTGPAGPGQPKVNVLSPSGQLTPAPVSPGPEGFVSQVQATEPGPHEVYVAFNDQPIQKSPFKVTAVPEGQTPGITVKDLPKSVPVGRPVPFKIDTTGAGPGQAKVNVVGPSGRVAPAPVGQAPDGFVSQILATEPGPQQVHVTFNDQPVPNSPFSVTALPEGQLPNVTLKDLPQNVPIGKAVPFKIVTAGAGPGQAKVNLVSPSGKVTPAPVGQAPDGFVSQILATEPGPHEVHVTFNDQTIQNSPYKVTAVPDGGAPTGPKVKAYGPGLEGGTAKSPADFTIDTREAGHGALGLTIDGPTKAEIECVAKEPGVYAVRYWPTEPGEYVANILYDEKPIPGSPFRAQVKPAQVIDVSGVRVYGPGVEPGVLLESVTEFTVDAKSVVPKNVGKPKVILTTPTSALQEVPLIDNNDGTYTALYTPFEEGTHKIDVSYNDQPVPNSPFNIQAKPGCDPSKVKAYGPGLQGAQPGKPAKFTISTRGAGSGGIGLSVVGPTEPKVSCSDNQDGTLTVEYLADSLGDHEIEVTFNGQPIPGSPFHVNVTETATVNPNAVKCFGPGLNPEGVRKGTPGLFTVDATEAGEAKLEVITTDVVNGHRVTNDVVKVKEGVYDVTYVPDFEGPCRVDVKYADQPVPKSPFTTQIQPSTDLSKVTVSGEGVSPSQPVQASIPVSFVVDTRKAGVTQKLDVDVKGPQGRPIQPSIQPVGDGTYLVSYTPEDVGPHTVAVKYAGKDLPTGPIRVNAVPTGDASKVRVPVETIKRTLVVAEESVITVRKEEAGYGNITATITSTATTETIETVVTDNMDGTVTIRYTPVRAGVYKIDLKYGGVAVPNGHIEQTVTETTVTAETLMRATTTTQQSVQEAPVSAQTVPLAQQGAPSALVDVPNVQPAPQEGAPSPFHATDFNIKIGADFKQTDAIVTTPSGVKHRPRIVDNGNGTIKVCYQPAEFGQHTLEVFYSGVPVPKSPFTFFVHEKKPGNVSAFGPGLTSGVAGQPTYFTVVTKDSGPGGLGLGIEGPSKAQIQCKDNKDGTATITYTPLTPGDYKITVKFGGKPIQGAPFTAKVSPAEFIQETQELLRSQSVTQQHAAQQSVTSERTSHMTVGRTSVMSLTTSVTDLTNLTAIIRSPSGAEEPCLLKRQPTGQLGISFTPRESGEHWVTVLRNGQPIPGSPFKISITGMEVANASKVKITGQGLVTATANQVNQFDINTKEAGVGGLSLSVVGPSKVEIKCEENPDGTTKVTYKPTEPGQYQIAIKYADEHIPGSPFTINVGGQGSGRVTESIVRQQQATQTTTRAGSTCELNIKMAGINVRELEGSVTSPTGVVSRCDVVDAGDNKFTVRFQPTETGVHIVSLKNKGFHIPGSPFQFTVGPIAGGGPHKVKAVGSGLERGEVNKPCPFTIITREAGPGSLSMGIEGPSKAKIDFQDKKDGTSDVTYVVTEPGEYLITVKYNGEPIPDSPFKVSIAAVTGETQKLNIQNLQQQGLAVNNPTQFTVDFNGAQGRLEAKVVAPSGTETDAVVQEIQKDKYAVNFVPRESGVHLVHVKLNGNHVPGSPYPVQVGRQDADAGKVIAYGDGLVKGNTGQICKFIVNTANAGSGALSIGISGPSKVELQSREVEEGYEFSYTPLAPGDYIITIKYAGNAHIPGSPFRARIEGAGKPAQFAEESRVVVETVTKTTTTTTTQFAQQQFQLQQQQHAQQAQQPQQLTGDASKVRAMGAGLQQATVNQETMFSIDGSNAGYNMLLMGIAGPTIPCEQLTAIHLGRLQYTVKYRLSMPGQYVLVVKWGDQHIPGSPYRIIAQ